MHSLVSFPFNVSFAVALKTLLYIQFCMFICICCICILCCLHGRINVSHCHSCGSFRNKTESLSASNFRKKGAHPHPPSLYPPVVMGNQKNHHVKLCKLRVICQHNLEKITFQGNMVNSLGLDPNLVKAVSDQYQFIADKIWIIFLFFHTKTF